MSDLQFQGLMVDVPRRFRSFYGRNIDQMLLLLSGEDEAGDVVDVPRVPMTLKQLLYERVHGENVHDRKLLQDNYVDTACAVISGDSSGEVLVGLYSDPLVKELIHGLNPGSRLQGGSLLVGADAYQEIKENAFVIPSDAVSNLRSSPFDEQVVREGFWNYIAEGDAELVRDHLSLVQERRGGSMKNRMGLWVSPNPGLRLLCARSVGGYYGGGVAYGLHLGYYDGGRLVGVVAPEAPQE